MILITGAAGFIGSKVAQKFIELGYETITIDNLSTGV
jgi:nucleoside-diphosphate-sugar epimerase